MSSTRRLASINAALRASPLLINGVSADDYKAKLTECKAALEKFIDKMNANPIMVRLAWHDSGTYDKEVRSAPTAGERRPGPQTRRTHTNDDRGFCGCVG